ncbi:MAG TPA: thiaminase II [Candidatus Binatia bacterium]|nr:thiaminase II [Candidatus Binatia bacterium]
MTMPFHQSLREAAHPVWEAIFAHPFVRELGAGTLARARFLFFVRQDYLYLQDFARVLCLGGAKADSLETLDIFADHAATVVRVERNLHTNWSGKLGLTPQELAGTVRAPVTQAYTRHLLAVAQSGTLAETVAAVLPCYWIYWEVGTRLCPSLPADPLYAEWIQAYSSEGFGAHVQQQLDLIDRLAVEVSSVERERLQEHFVQSCRYEYLFWEQAYQQEGWPV